MVTTVTPYTDLRNRADVGALFDGVVRVSFDGRYGTGTLLYGGRAVLTSAHLFASASVADTSIAFETTAGSQTLLASEVVLQPGYDAAQDNNDLALVWLSGSAPLAAQRYELYRSNDEIGQTMTLVGYGEPGSGATGVLASYSGSPLRLRASNQFDADAAALKTSLGSQMNWTPTPATQLIADFDNGSAAQDALARLIGRPGTGLGQSEGLISPGDSGGPAFIGTKVAGIASYTASLSQGSSAPDIDASSNSSFGEIAAWQRVSHYQQWIDQSLRTHYPNAPSKPQDVQKAVPEGNSGTSFAYFLLQFLGLRADPGQLLSVDYATRDGTATAGQDYLGIQGTLVLYPDENQAVIAVEIIGDSTPEANETFYLDISHPVGGSFAAGVVTLTAVRTIINDDGVGHA